MVCKLHDLNLTTLISYIKKAKFCLKLVWFGFLCQMNWIEEVGGEYFLNFQLNVRLYVGTHLDCSLDYHRIYVQLMRFGLVGWC